MPSRTSTTIAAANSARRTAGLAQSASPLERLRRGPHHGDQDADPGQVGVAIGHRLDAGLHQTEHRDQRAEEPQPAHDRIAAAAPADGERRDREQERDRAQRRRRGERAARDTDRRRRGPAARPSCPGSARTRRAALAMRPGRGKLSTDCTIPCWARSVITLAPAASASSGSFSTTSRRQDCGAIVAAFAEAACRGLALRLHRRCAVGLHADPAARSRRAGERTAA